MKADELRRIVRERCADLGVRGKPTGWARRHGAHDREVKGTITLLQEWEIGDRFYLVSCTDSPGTDPQITITPQTGRRKS